VRKMLICNFSNITKIINNYIGVNVKINQVDFFIKLFHHFAKNNSDFDFDNGNICRWLKGTKNISGQISRFYGIDRNKEHLSVDIEENILPMLTDTFKAADDIYYLVNNDITISHHKKVELTKNYPCEDICDIADFIAECIVFSLERKAIKQITKTQENDIVNAYNQLVFAIDNFKSYAEQIINM
jgi:hypothetical protein